MWRFQSSDTPPRGHQTAKKNSIKTSPDQVGRTQERHEQDHPAPAQRVSRLERLDAALPLGLKLVLPVIFIAIAGSSLLGFTVYRAESSRIRSDYDARALLVTESMRSAAASYGIANALPDDNAGVQRYLDSLVELTPAIVRIDLFRVNREALEVIASSDHSGIGASDNAAERADELLAIRNAQIIRRNDIVGDTPTLRVVMPFGDALNGEFGIAVHLSSDERADALSSLRWEFLLGTGGTSLIAAVVLAIGLYLFVFRRIKLLLSAARRLQSGDLEARVGHRPFTHPRDEMLRLANGFDSMAVSNQALHAEVQMAATTDELTGLYNRRFAMDALDREIARARRQGEPLSVIMADLDGLKQINDNLGHGAGDLALRLAAGALRNVLRAGDLAARLGGDEFIVVLPGCYEALLAAVLARLHVVSTSDASDERVASTISTGGAVLEADDNADTLLKRADAALYDAKRAGKNCSRIAA
jgi:diguanylate cyclase (GGDEF)-like protein